MSGPPPWSDPERHSHGGEGLTGLPRAGDVTVPSASVRQCALRSRAALTRSIRVFRGVCSSVRSKRRPGQLT